MDGRARRVTRLRVLGTIALDLGLLIAVWWLLADLMDDEWLFFAAFLVVTGLALRVEAAIVDRPGMRRVESEKDVDWYR